MSFGDALPARVTPLPGSLGERWVEVLARTECPALTARRARRAEVSGAAHDPIVWAEASGANVRDVDGNVFVDLTAGFGVAAVGHRHPRVVRAVETQASLLLHALGDVHPSDTKVALLERLTELAPFDDARVILGLNGSDAVTAALKTAVLATGRSGVLAFEGGYHGLMYGPLAACGYGSGFREPFAEQEGRHVRFAPLPAAGDVPEALARVDAAWDGSIGAVLLEPALGRGGCRALPPAFLQGVATRARDRGALLILDEIYVGLGRTGALWAHEAAGIEADLLCLGKALGGGLPISACLGRDEVMQAWGDPEGEALHTATFAGYPLGCAASLAALEVLEEEDLPARAARVGAWLVRRLRDAVGDHPAVLSVDGVGLLVGVTLDDGARTLRLLRLLLEAGYLTLPAGSGAEVLAVTPPLTIAEAQLEAFVVALRQALEAT